MTGSAALSLSKVSAQFKLPVVVFSPVDGVGDGYECTTLGKSKEGQPFQSIHFLWSG